MSTTLTLQTVSTVGAPRPGPHLHCPPPAGLSSRGGTVTGQQ
jgi:hypothetical protein